MKTLIECLDFFDQLGKPRVHPILMADSFNYIAMIDDTCVDWLMQRGFEVTRKTDELIKPMATGFVTLTKGGEAGISQAFKDLLIKMRFKKAFQNELK